MCACVCMHVRVFACVCTTTRLLVRECDFRVRSCKRKTNKCQ
jgi:hypothetical protein